MTEPTKPIFGPNGAVLNAPSVTPEMREKLERDTGWPTWRQFRREGQIFIGALVVIAVGLVASLLKAWWAIPTSLPIIIVVAIVLTLSPPADRDSAE